MLCFLRTCENASMALSRLLQPKSNLPICIRRFSTKRVGFCSSVCSNSNSDRTPQLKKDAAAEESRETTVEPLVNESARTEPGIVSKAATTRNEKGAPWYSLKDVVHILKDKMLGINQPQYPYTVDAPTVVDCTASVVIPCHDVPVHGSGELQDSEAMTKFQNDVIFNDEKITVGHGKSCMAGEVYDEAVSAITSEVNQMLNFAQGAETGDGDAVNTKSMRVYPGISSLSSGENYCEETTRLNDSELVVEEAEFLKSDEVSSPIFSDLEEDPILNPENLSSLRPPTISLNSTRCVKVEKNEMIIANVPVSLGSERGAFSEVFDGSKKASKLVDLFRGQNHDQTSNEAKIEHTYPEEALSDLLLKFERKRASQLSHSSPTYCLFPEAASDSEGDHFKEIPIIGREKNGQEDKNLRFGGDETSSPSNGTQNIFDSKDLDMKSINDPIVDENFKPRSRTFTQFEDSNEPCEVDAEKLSDIKDLIDFIKLQDIIPSTTTIDNSNTGRTIEKPSNSNSQGFIFNNWLTASNFTTENSRIENEKKSDWEFQSLGDTELKASLEILNPTRKADEKSRNSVLSDSSNSNSQKFVDSERLNSTDFTTVKSRIEDEERVDLDFRSFGSTELKTGMEIPNPTKNIDREKLENSLLTSKDSNHNRVVVKFLRKVATKMDILEIFERYGTILKIEIPDVEGPLFKTAYIHFKTREGFQRAIKDSDIVVRHAVVTVESATSKKNATGKTPVPNLIGDPDVPTALIKNPSRTVKIQHLTCDITSHHIKEALFFCESNVCGYFLGSSNSVAFVEFETESGKERALLKHSINVLGKQLTVLRIDAPRTTVVRVHVDPIQEKNIIMSLCRSLGKTRVPLIRCPGIVDVHYKLAEWPNMWNILNRLNGVEVEGRRVRAEPAPIFPPDILLALWRQPKERKYLKNTALALLQKLGKYTRGTAELDSLEKIVEDKKFNQ